MKSVNIIGTKKDKILK